MEKYQYFYWLPH